MMVWILTSQDSCKRCLSCNWVSDLLFCGISDSLLQHVECLVFVDWGIYQGAKCMYVGLELVLCVFMLLLRIRD